MNSSFLLFGLLHSFDICLPAASRDLEIWHFSLSSITFRFQDSLKGTESYLNLSLRRLPGCQALEPESRFDETLDAFVLPFLVGESNDFIRKSRNERDEDHPRSHLVPEGKMMGNEGKDKDAH
jgi:hypothetical protein